MIDEHLRGAIGGSYKPVNGIASHLRPEVVRPGASVGLGKGPD